MTDLSWAACVLWTAFLLICGCGRTTSTSRAYNHLVAASAAITAGDKETAFKELSASIDTSPSAWAYFERSRINLEKGDEAAAEADCEKGLQLDPKYRDLLWLTAELKKPAAKRFKGKFAKPPGLK